MLKFKELELFNFRSWEHLKLENLDSKGLILIQGTNGVGKSSIRQGIEYLLLDKTSDSLPLPELPRNKNTECIIRGIIQKDNDIIEIKKYRNSKTKGNQTILTINGNDYLTATNRRVTQKNIENLLDINDKTLFISTIFSQNSSSFPEAKETERKQVLYDALDLHKYEDRHKEAKKVCKEAKAVISKNDDIIAFKVESLKELSDSIKESQKKNELFEEQKLIEIQEIKDSMQEKEEPTENLQKKADSIKLRDIREDKKSLTDKKYDLKYQIKALKDKIKKKEEDSESISDNICPILNEECDRLNTGVIIKEPEEEFDDQFDSKLHELEIVLKNIIANLKSVEEDEEFNLNQTLIKNEILSDISRIKIYNKILRESKVEAEKKIQKVKDSVNPWEDIIEEDNKKLEKLKDEISNLIKNNKQENIKLKYYTFWKEGYSKSGLPNLKISGYLENIESKTNEILADISDNIYIQIEDQSETAGGEVREKVDYQIHHPDREITNYQSYSGGEKQRIKLADIFTFSELIGKFNFIFLDEVLELSLDEDGKDSIIDYLKSRSKDFGSIFVISHDDSIKSKFSNIATITKSEGVSKLNE